EDHVAHVEVAQRLGGRVFVLYLADVHAIDGELELAVRLVVLRRHAHVERDRLADLVAFEDRAHAVRESRPVEGMERGTRAHEGQRIGLEYERVADRRLRRGRAGREYPREDLLARREPARAAGEPDIARGGMQRIRNVDRELARIG